MIAFRKLIAGVEPLVAPLVINPISARLAAAAGFRALYRGGDLGRLGYKLIVYATTPLLAMHRALRDAYAAMAEGELDPLVGSDRHAEQEEIHRTIDLDAMMLEIERRTVER